MPILERITDQHRRHREQAEPCQAIHAVSPLYIASPADDKRTMPALILPLTEAAAHWPARGALIGLDLVITGLLGLIVSGRVPKELGRNSLRWQCLITIVVGVVIGGLASISGAIYGALFIQFIPNVADQLSKAAPWAIYGIFLIVFMFVMPTGVAGFIRMLRARATRPRIK